MDAKQFEQDKAKNLFRSFGWDWVSTEVTGDDVRMSFQKVSAESSQSTKMFEIERISNLGKVQGWSVFTSSIDGDKVKITFSKVVKGEV